MWSRVSGHKMGTPKKGNLRMQVPILMCTSDSPRNGNAKNAWEESRPVSPP